MSDFHLLPRPVTLEQQRLSLQLALAPPFTPASELEWTTITQVDLPPRQQPHADVDLRAQVGRVLLDGLTLPAEARPGSALLALINGYGRQASELDYQLKPIEELPLPAAAPPLDWAVSDPGPRFTEAPQLDSSLPPGVYQLTAGDERAGAICGWLMPPSDGCALGQITLRGVPIPAGAANFEDKIAALEIAVDNKEIRPGQMLDLAITWQSLAPMEEDYTVFVQILDAADRIVGQVDAWPLQGTLPTSQWDPGEIIEDPYSVALSGDLPPGPYRLQIGWYLLATSRRLARLDENGVAIDDKIVISDLVAP